MFVDIVLQMKIFTLPIRNWNADYDYPTEIGLLDFYSTYKELKRCNVCWYSLANEKFLLYL